MNDPSILVLTSLADGDKHGYLMMEDIRVFSGVPIGPGTLYGAIARLEKAGLILAVPSDDPRRQPYRITGMGRQHLRTVVDGLDRITRAASGRLTAGKAGTA